MLWSQADLHIHTSFSDGTATPAQVLAHVAERTTLRAIAITDHDTIAGALQARRIAHAYGVEVIVGEEVSTLEGHLLALFIERPIAPGQTVAQTIAAIHAQGGLAIPAHPYGMVTPSLGRRGLLAHASEWPIDAVEVFNAGLWLPENNCRARRAAGQLGVACTGGSDSHELATIGMGYTSYPGRTASDLYRAIRERASDGRGRLWGWGPNASIVARWLVASTASVLRPALSR